MCVEFYGGPWDGHVAHTSTGEVPYTVLIPIFPTVDMGFFNNATNHDRWMHYYQLDQSFLDLGVIWDGKPRYQYKGVVQQ